MKKMTLTITCALAMTCVVFAQGNVNWSTIPFNAITVETNITQGSPLFGGGGISSWSGPVAPAGAYYFELLYSAYTGVQALVPSTWAQLTSWSDAGLEAQSALSAGRLSPINGTPGATVPWSPGTTDSIVLVGWSANLGTTWAAAESVLNNYSYYFTPNAYFGVSQTGYITTLPTTTSPGAVVFATGPTAQGLPIYSPNMQLYPIIPEPGTMALVGLGGLAFWLMHRRK